MNDVAKVRNRRLQNVAGVSDGFGCLGRSGPGRARPAKQIEVKMDGNEFIEHGCEQRGVGRPRFLLCSTRHDHAPKRDVRDKRGRPATLEKKVASVDRWTQPMLKSLILNAHM
jgi:hypothetical protein